MNILKEESENSDLRTNQKSNEFFKTNVSHLGEVGPKPNREKFSSFTNIKDGEIFGGLSTTLNNPYNTNSNNNKNNFMSL
jgi:hypothetical protein